MKKIQIQINFINPPGANLFGHVLKKRVHENISPVSPAPHWQLKSNQSLYVFTLWCTLEETTY